ncbi:PREDICTED: allantoinase, mitochondrial isoform X3 [Ceratosolen solmsi marchali]|uniref:allantoinase n=1 Tax=Ceratosolen solmsi marchali TaxID=326594 RepID=A0AAJ7DUE4_9HYME|nr:PREDICTED: allantoinase, mitochondrial isoform X3 [Ceratosolen solmsi marchali]
MSGSTVKLYISRRTVLPDGLKSAILKVSDGKIEEIIVCSDDEEINEKLQKYRDIEHEDFGHLILMPGIVDSHVHLNEPGRSHWEGFWTATRAAAAGGVTTIIDMPLNSIPPTTTLKNLKIKARTAQNKIFVDVGFWGGVLPDNQKELKSLVEAGVVGFKCFLCPSGVEEFPHVNENDVKKALIELKDLNTVLAFHAECEVNGFPIEADEDPFDYHTYLKTRPPVMETEAIKIIVNLCKTFNCRCHIVHLSASEALNLIRKAKEQQLLLTAETCYHYLHFIAEKIPRSATQYKCCPPIRYSSNKEKLWSALKDGTLDMVVSDHSPCTEDLKKTGNFLKDWGGISSLQFGLSLFWSQSKMHGLSFQDIARLLCSAPAALCGLNNQKGSLRVGMDADFVIWDPEKTIEINQNGILHKNKITPYINETLFGKVYGTIVRGSFVYKNGEFCKEPMGQLLLRDTFISDLMN